MTTPSNPTYTWSQLSAFRAHILSLGGSGDVGSGAAVPGDVDITGRYARQYSKDLPDANGRTISFWCSANRPGKYGTPGYTPVILLTGCPWGTAAERDATYQELALSGCRPNDMRDDSEMLAQVERARIGDPVELINLTPHAVTIGEVPIAPSGQIARAKERPSAATPILVCIPDPTGGPTARIEHQIPTVIMEYRGVEGLPDPQPGLAYIVSMVVPSAAAATGRTTSDLFVPGEQVRDSAGRIIGCRSLQRA